MLIIVMGPGHLNSLTLRYGHRKNNRRFSAQDDKSSLHSKEGLL
jgi:hypothetical protein